MRDGFLHPREGYCTTGCVRRFSASLHTAESAPYFVTDQDVYAASQRAYILVNLVSAALASRYRDSYLLVTNQDVYAASQRAYILVVYVLAAS